MIFRLIIFLSVFFSVLNNSFALETTYSLPTIAQMTSTGNVVNYNYIKDLKIYAGNNSHIQFCYQVGGTYVSHSTLGGGTILMAYFNGSWIDTYAATYIANLVCDIPEEPEPIIQTIIDSDPGINKSVFDEDTLKAIYLIEVVIIFFFFFFRFFYRLQT